MNIRSDAMAKTFPPRSTSSFPNSIFTSFPILLRHLITFYQAEISRNFNRKMNGRHACTEVKIRIWTVRFPRRLESSRNHAEVAHKMMSIWVHHIQLTIGDSSSGIFSSNFLGIRFDSWQCMRDTSIPSKYLCSWLYLCAYRLTFWLGQLRSIVNLHFCLMDKAIIASSWCDLSVGLLSIRQKWKLRSLDRKIVIFEFVSDADDLVTPNNSHECPIGP